MSRPLRVKYAGAVYHITSRGNEYKSIFKGAGDRRLFLNVLNQTGSRFRWFYRGYVLMGNHYHLLIETSEPNLSRGRREIGEYPGLHYSSISLDIKRYENGQRSI